MKAKHGQGSIGPGNMNRRGKQYIGQALVRLTEIQKQINSVEKMTYLHKYRSREHIYAMKNGVKCEPKRIKAVTLNKRG